MGRWTPPPACLPRSRLRRHTTSGTPPGGGIVPPPRPFEPFDPRPSKKEAPLVLRLPQEGIRMPGGRIGFANRDFELRKGEHVCVIGRNGQGKSCFWKALSGRKSIIDDETGQGGAKQQRKSLSFMSFSMHKDFVTEYRDKFVCDVLGGSKDALARTLIVSLGLYPVWYKRVGVLSTGEIRKVLLAYVLSKSPRVVVLDKPFDGLDAPSRGNLKGVLSQLCQGFPRLLVEGFSKRIDPTEMILITHRQEEIPQEVAKVVAVADLDIDFTGPKADHEEEIRRRLTHDRSSSPPSAGGVPSTVLRLPQPFRPQVTRAETLENDRTKARLSTVVELVDVHLEKEDYTILDHVTWGVQQGQCWTLKGLNGAGKSTIVKLIKEAHERRLRQHQPASAMAQLSDEKEDKSGPSSSYTGCVSVGVPHLGLVSTEVHLSLAASLAHTRTENVVLSGLLHHPSSLQAGTTVSSVHHLTARHRDALREWGELLHLSSLYERPFGELSQGQQKLAIIARALIGAPQLLIMDEACQGLDSHHRGLVLSLLDRIVQGCSWLSTLYISHHEDEVLDGVTHVLDLKKGRVVFQGKKDTWYPHQTPQPN